MEAITDAAMLAALEEIVASQDDPEGYYTLNEWVEATGMSKLTIKKRLATAKKVGRLEVARVTREAIDMRPMQIPAYRILPEQ